MFDGNHFYNATAKYVVGDCYFGSGNQGNQYYEENNLEITISFGDKSQLILMA